MESPADYATFNSITNNNQIGDERNFVRVREKGVGNFRDSAVIEAGKRYTVQIFYHNNAKSSLNDWQGHCRQRACLFGSNFLED